MDTASIDIPNSRAIAKQLLTLSQDPDNQPFIVQEQGCLAGLVQYTQHEDIDVVLVATRALQFLSSHSKNKTIMREFPDLVDNVRGALARSHEIPRLDEFARGTLANLAVLVGDEEYSDDDDEEYEAKEDSENCASHSNNRGSKSASLSGLGKASKISNTSRELQTITLALEELEDVNIRAEIEMLIIRVPGAISVTTLPGRGFVRVGTRGEVDIVERALIRALSAAGYYAKIVLGKNTSRNANGDDDEEEGDEQSYNGNNTELEDDEDYPEYLEEEDYDDDWAEDTGRIARQGFSSLEARLEQQRKEEEARKLEKSSRLIGKVSNALANASSWLMGY